MAQDFDGIWDKKDILILQNLYENRAGLLAKTISKLTDLPRRTLYNRLKNLEKKELIENIRPIWKISHGGSKIWHYFLKSSKIFELHNLSYVLKLMKVPNWWNKRKPRLERLKGWQFKNINFGNGETNQYQQLVNENFVIQTYPESIIIISRKRYYSNSPYEVIIEAMNDVLDIIAYFEERMKFKFFPNGIPALELRGNDYNRIADYLAEHCKKEGRRFLVETPKGKVWVDYSEPFGKEANTPDIQDTLEKHTKDLIMNKPMTNSELQNAIQGLTLVQIEGNRQLLAYSEQNVQHLAIIKEYREESRANRKESIANRKLIKFFIKKFGV
jgi:DNA-binding Lrp family transcriptional regulator